MDSKALRKTVILSKSAEENCRAVRGMSAGKYENHFGAKAQKCSAK